MNYPLDLRFKFVAISPQVSVTDAAGRLVFYVKQKAFKLKESVLVFGDREQTRPVAKIDADRILDISATYHLRDSSGGDIGAVRRHGLKSLWRAHYGVLRQDTELMTIRERNPFIKVMDGIFGEIPVVGILSGYVFQPTYDVTRTDGTPVLRVRKRPSFLESRFRVERLGQLAPDEEALAIMSILMMVLLERSRG